MDIYSHAWPDGLNLGGFNTKRKYKRITSYRTITINSGWDIWDWFDFDDIVQQESEYNDVEIDGSTQDWTTYDKKDWRRFDLDEIIELKQDSFSAGCEIYLWGCRAAGNPTRDSSSIASKLASHIGNGCSVYAFAGDGGSMLVTDTNGKIVYNGNMIPAKAWFNKNGKDTQGIDPMTLFEKFSY